MIVTPKLSFVIPYPASDDRVVKVRNIKELAKTHVALQANNGTVSKSDAPSSRSSCRNPCIPNNLILCSKNNYYEGITQNLP